MTPTLATAARGRAGRGGADADNVVSQKQTTYMTPIPKRMPISPPDMS